MATGGNAVTWIWDAFDPEMTHDLNTSEHIECTNLQCQLNKPD